MPSRGVVWVQKMWYFCQNSKSGTLSSHLIEYSLEKGKEKMVFVIKPLHQAFLNVMLWGLTLITVTLFLFCTFFLLAYC